MFEKVYSLKLYILSRPVLFMVIASLVLNLLTWGWIVFQIEPTADPIFLSYTMLFGTNLIGSWWKLFYMPLIGSVVLIGNTVAGWLTFHKDTFFSHMLLATSMLVQLFLFFATWVLVFLNV